MSGPLLAAHGLAAWYGAAQALFDVALEVRAGEAVALLGRNGAGKSTTLKTIMGLMPRRAGVVTFAGVDIARLPPFRIARAGLGYTPEDRRIFTDLTLDENLGVARGPARRFPEGAPAPNWTRADVFALFPNLAAMPDRLGDRMSGGEQQMLAVGRTLMGNPLCVMLDEPSEGMAPLVVAAMARAINALKAQGLAVLLAEQNLGFAAALCDRAIVLDQGRVAWTGAMSAVAQAPEARALLSV